MLGKNDYEIISNKQIRLQIDNIVEARPIVTRDTVNDIFMLGYICGKRAERAKKRGALHG